MHLFGTHFGTYEVVRDGSGQAALQGFGLDPQPSPIGAAYLDLKDHPARVLYPMARKGWLAARENPEGRGRGRGRDEFIRISWDEAAALAAGEVERVRTVHGNAAIFGGSYGWASAGRFHHAQGQLKRFLNLAGGFTSAVNTYSFGAGAVILPHVIGPRFKFATDVAPSWDQIAAHARLLISFGGFRLSNAQVEAGGTGQHRSEGGLAAAAAAGVRIVVVSPVRTDVPDLPGGTIDYIAIRPNTDTAMLLAMAQTLLAEGLADRAFLTRCTVGLATLEAYLAGESDGVVKDADWAAGICGVPAATIRDLAFAFASEPALVNAAWSLQRARFGEQPYWAAIALAAIAGHAGKPGCGIAFGLTSVSTVGQPIRRLRGPAFDQGRNPVESFIPVARITELLSQPGGTLDYDGRQLTLPNIRLVWWAGGNPFHHHQDLAGLTEAWRRPETVIVNEPMWTATARHADIVLPASFPFERDDIAASSRDNWLIASRQVCVPPGEVLSDHQIMARIAREMGFEPAFTGGREPREWLRRMYDGYRTAHAELPDFEAFWARGYAALNEGEAAPAPVTPLADFVADPEGKPLETPSGRIEIASATIAGFGYDDCPGHPAWLAPEEWLGSPLAQRYPLHLLSPQPAHRLHSQLELAGPSQGAKRDGYEVVLMHPAEATKRGLRNGDIVELFNDRGRCLAALRATREVEPGVAVLPTGAWYDPVGDGGALPLDRGGNPNSLTSSMPTSRLAQATAPNSCLIEIKRAVA